MNRSERKPFSIAALPGLQTNGLSGTENGGNNTLGRGWVVWVCERDKEDSSSPPLVGRRNTLQSRSRYSLFRFIREVSSHDYISFLELAESF